MDIANLLVLAMALYFVLQSIFHLREDAFIVIVVLTVDYFCMFGYILAFSYFPPQTQGKGIDFISCLIILAFYEHVILKIIVRLFRFGYAHISKLKLWNCTHLEKWLPRELSKVDELPMYKLMKNCTYLLLVLVYMGLKLTPTNLIGVDYSSEAIGILFLFDTCIDKHKDLSKDIISELKIRK